MRRGRKHLFEIVEHEQAPSIAQLIFDAGEEIRLIRIDTQRPGYPKGTLAPEAR